MGPAAGSITAVAESHMATIYAGVGANRQDDGPRVMQPRAIGSTMAVGKGWSAPPLQQSSSMIEVNITWHRTCAAWENAGYLSI